MIHATITPLFLSGLWVLFDWFEPVKPSWMPPRASDAAGDVDQVFNLIFWMSAFFYVLIVVVAIAFAIRYRQSRARPRAQDAPTHNTTLELTWSILPLILVVVLFGWSTKVWLKLTHPKVGEDAQHVQVTGRKWAWWFDHEGGHGSNELHIVAGRTVELVMSSEDVLHSLYLPAFRVKQDLVPGRYTRMYLTATEPGTYPIKCAEFCGTNHSQMASNVVVHPDQAAYDDWIAGQDTSSMPLPALGRRIYETRACMGCHSDDGSRRVGPSFKGIWGHTVELEGGGTATVDEGYIRESIVEPRAKIVAGYPPAMPPTPLEDREIIGIIEYIKSLQ